MKRMITADTDYMHSYEGMHPYFETIDAKASDLGYELHGDGYSDIVLTKVKDNKRMPDIYVETELEGGVVYFNCSLSFPILDTTELDYADSMEYWIVNRWGKVAKLITYLQKNPLVLDMWGED